MCLKYSTCLQIQIVLFEIAYNNYEIIRMTFWLNIETEILLITKRDKA